MVQSIARVIQKADPAEQVSGWLQGTKDILDAWLNNRPFHDSFYIVREGELAPQYK